MSELPAVLRACDAVGRVIEFWGFSRHLGRIWTLLYLSPEPLPAAEIQRQLAVSAGAASMHLRELQRWGVVRKVWVPGERKDFYEAETDLWKMVFRVMQERETKLLDETEAALQQSVEQLRSEAAQQASSDPDTAASLEAFRTERLEGLLEFTRLGRMVLGMLVQDGGFDLRAIESLLFGPGLPGSDASAEDR
ncbi:MAG: ArsR family transcriptional regulator [Planctomycetota bacterium]|nr:MAG: ArsR family transcriptional regulator [Planctomycetota bacterium]